MTLATASTTDRHFDRFRALVQDATGVCLPKGKRLMIESRLRRRIAALGRPDLGSYLAHLFEEGGLEAEMPQIIEVITTHKTDFFREPAHYRFLTEKIVPEALARAGGQRTARFRLWSAAASSGAEAWSAAMLLARAAANDPRLDWAILGTDIAGGVLETARRAIYPEAELAPVPRDLVARYSLTGRDGQGQPVARIVPELRARVRFATLNLLSTPYAVETGLDMVFLRNVLIYFDTATQDRVTRALAQHLRPGGYLVVGHSESMSVRVPGLTQVAAGVFRREGAG